MSGTIGDVAAARASREARGSSGGARATSAASGLLPYSASFCSKEARGGTELQSFLFSETLGLLKTAFPRLTRGFLKRRVCAPKSECLILLASSAGGQTGSPPTPAKRFCSWHWQQRGPISRGTRPRARSHTCH